MLDQFNRVNLLYDFYASLLTERQREILSLYFRDNYSLGEIAEEYLISRQAVHDLIRRAVKSLENHEYKLGYCALFEEQQKLLSLAEEILKADCLDQADLDELRVIINKMRITTER